MDHMGSLADVRLGDIARALGRYRPVVITVGLILFVVALLPAPRRAALSALPSVPPPAQAAAGEAPAADAGAAESTSVDAGASSASGSDVTSSPSSSSSSSDSSFSSSDASSSDSFDSSDASGSSSEFRSPSSDFSSTESTATTAAPRPLTIAGAGWSSATASTPVGATGVPAGSLPIGKRIGQVDKFSFVRLQGEAAVLVLPEVTEGARTTTGNVGISACQITAAGWPEQENVPSDRAPKYDPASCVAGSRGADGSWSFNLLTFTTRNDARGFALVPTGDSIDYQVNLKR